MAGGYRQGSGRSKSGYYNGIYCGSTYELCWVIYSLDHGIGFTRFPSGLEKDGIRYFPDFLLADGKTIIETKGYESQDKVDIKTKVAESFGYSVVVLRKGDLSDHFAYVTDKFGTTQYHTLYDGYKPKYSYTCSQCGTSYMRDRVIRTALVFCCRRCAGRYRKAHIMANPVSKQINSDRMFSKEQALFIFSRTDKSLAGIAEEYGVNKNTVWFIKQKRTYKWIHT